MAISVYGRFVAKWYTSGSKPGDATNHLRIVVHSILHALTHIHVEVCIHLEVLNYHHLQVCVLCIYIVSLFRDFVMCL